MFNINSRGLHKIIYTLEIEHKYKYIQELKHLLDERGITYPEEYEID